MTSPRGAEGGSRAVREREDVLRVRVRVRLVPTRDARDKDDKHDALSIIVRESSRSCLTAVATLTLTTRRDASGILRLRTEIRNCTLIIRLSRAIRIRSRRDERRGVE